MSETPRPSVLPVNPDGVPDQLKALPQWILWRLEWIDGRWTKTPYQAEPALRRREIKAKTNDPDTWTDFETVMTALTMPRKEPYTGIGFCLIPDGGLCVIDFDDAIQDGELTLEAQTILGLFPPTFVEISPSGTGLHVWVKGRKPGKRSRKKLDGIELEIYDGTSGRYLTVTGHPHV